MLSLAISQTVLRAPRGFSPLSLSPRLYWSGRQGQLFTDTAGTTPVSADNQAVALLRDESGAGRDFSQANIGARPLVGGLTTGRPFIVGDGNDDQLVGPVLNQIIGTGAYEVVIAARFTARPASVVSSWQYPSLLSDIAGGYFSAGHISPTQLGHYAWGAPAAEVHARQSYTLGTDVVIDAWCDGVNIYFALDKNIPAQTAQAGPSPRTNTTRLLGVVAAAARVSFIFSVGRVLTPAERAAIVTHAATTQGRSL